MNDYRAMARDLMGAYGIIPSSTRRADEAVRRYRKRYGDDDALAFFLDAYIEHPADTITRRLDRLHVQRSCFYKHLGRAEERIGMILSGMTEEEAGEGVC